MRLAGHPNSILSEKLSDGPNSLRSQIEDSAHYREKKDTLIARAGVL
jgi:hypothetical protein